MQKKKYLLIGIIVVLLFIVFLVNSMGSDPGKFTLEKTDFIETIAASGRVEAANRITMTYQKTGVIEDILVSEGDAVQKGELLLSLIKDEEENSLQSTIIQLRLAENEFAAINQKSKLAKARFDAAKSNRENIDLELERNLILYDLGAVSQKEIETIKLRLQEAISSEIMADIDYQNLQPGGVTRSASLLAVETAKNNVERSEIEKNKKIIFAPFDGIVLEIVNEPFSPIQSGQPAIVFAEEQSYIIADIDERDYQKVEQGQKVFVQLINRDMIIEGTVRDVSPKIDRSKGTVRVRIDLVNEEVLTPDTGVNIEIIVNEFKEQFVIPKPFLFSDPSRIIINDNNRAKVIEISEYQSVGEYYLITSPNLDQYEGQEIINIDLEDDQKI